VSAIEAMKPFILEMMDVSKEMGRLRQQVASLTEERDYLRKLLAERAARPLEANNDIQRQGNDISP
jgi:hypothetical protein